ncbi:hypothetical protein ACWIWK_06970 [Helicobacter sp. 23-1048]
MKKLSLVIFVAFVSVVLAENAKDDLQWDYADCEFEKLDESKIPYRWEYFKEFDEKKKTYVHYKRQVIANPKYDVEPCGEPVFTIIKAKSMQEAHDKLKKAKGTLYWERWGSGDSIDLGLYEYKLEFLGTLPKQDYRYNGKCRSEKSRYYKCDSEEWYAKYEWSKDKKRLTIEYATDCGDQQYILFDLGNGTFKIVATIARC